jgi:hypothetical protein
MVTASGRSTVRSAPAATPSILMKHVTLNQAEVISEKTVAVAIRERIAHDAH